MRTGSPLEAGKDSEISLSVARLVLSYLFTVEEGILLVPYEVGVADSEACL